ncbi:hypothetical protein VIGAN_04167700, partial [Vigna angularis var. angularis]
NFWPLNVPAGTNILVHLYSLATHPVLSFFLLFSRFSYSASICFLSIRVSPRLRARFVLEESICDNDSYPLLCSKFTANFFFRILVD